MSHFAVLVIGENVEEQLQPYHEYECTGVEDSYVVWIDMDEEVRKEWNDDGETHKQDYKNIQEFAEDWFGCELKDGKFGRYTNPNKKWDWWVIGGRWTGYFRLREKPSSTHATGQPGLMTEPAKVGTADQCLKKDIDFEGMELEARVKAEETYDQFEAVTQGLEVPPTWEEVRDHHEDIDKAREEYSSYPWVQTLREARLDPWGECTHNYFKIGKGGREAFIKLAVAKAFVPYAVVHESEWIAKGEMGWFGMSSDKVDQDQWCIRVKELIDSLSDDTLLTCVDCHI